MTFDVITIFIILLGIFNFVVFFYVRYRTKKLNEIIHPQNDRRHGMQADMSVSDEECANLNKSSQAAASSYALYTNITAIFPLLGILGTVLSLMRLSGTDDISAHFSVALKTTLFGLICAIVFKLFDSFISSKLDRALDDADYLIREHDREKRTK